MKKRKIIIIISAVVLVLSALALCVFFLSGEGDEAACDNSHAWGEWSSLSLPTCTESGRLERICRLCGESEARDSSPSSHILSDWADNGQGKYIKTCTVCREIVITKNNTSIGGGAFLGCCNVTSIVYEGTLAEWEKVNLGVEWFSGNTLTVKCSDGKVKIG